MNNILAPSLTTPIYISTLVYSVNLWYNEIQALKTVGPMQSCWWNKLFSLCHLSCPCRPCLVLPSSRDFTGSTLPGSQCIPGPSPLPRPDRSGSGNVCPSSPQRRPGSLSSSLLTPHSSLLTPHSSLWQDYVSTVCQLIILPVAVRQGWINRAGSVIAPVYQGSTKYSPAARNRVG